MVESKVIGLDRENPVSRWMYGLPQYQQCEECRYPGQNQILRDVIVIIIITIYASQRFETWSAYVPIGKPQNSLSFLIGIITCFIIISLIRSSGFLTEILLFLSSYGSSQSRKPPNLSTASAMMTTWTSSTTVLVSISKIVNEAA